MTQTTTKTEPQPCGGEKQAGPCEYKGASRVRFFHGMLLDEDALIAEQAYHRRKLQALGKRLFGTGVICGLQVEAAGKDAVVVRPGAALDPCGNLLELTGDLTVPLDLCKPKPTTQLTEEDCKELEAGGGRYVERYLCLEYAERGDAPVPVYVPGDDCRQRECEYSRIQEGVCVRLRQDCPCPADCAGLEDHELWDRLKDIEAAEGDAAEALRAELKQTLAELCCQGPVCCESHGTCVPLGKVRVDCCGENEVEILCECRPYVPAAPLVRTLAAALLGGVTIDQATFTSSGVYHDPIGALCSLLQNLDPGATSTVTGLPFPNAEGPGSSSDVSLGGPDTQGFPPPSFKGARPRPAQDRIQARQQDVEAMVDQRMRTFFADIERVRTWSDYKDQIRTRLSGSTAGDVPAVRPTPGGDVPGVTPGPGAPEAAD